MTNDFSQINEHQNHISNYIYFGVLIFLILSLGPWIAPNVEYIFLDLFLFYSTIVLTFLAGCVWGLALFSKLKFKRRHIHAAIIFSLWPLFSHLFPYVFQTALMMIGFLALLFWEKLFINSSYPDWYQQLRHRVTFIVVACHMFTIWSIIQT